MKEDIEASFTLCDPLNPGCGYQLRITLRGEPLLLTSRHPVTGKDLLSPKDCLDVIEQYTK